MRKNIKNVSSLFHYINPVLFTLFFFSCVYYNTFYNAEVNYKKAEQIIEQTPPSSKSDDDEIPAQAKKLLGKAIANCNIVIESYPTSKYVDDAYFIIGKASFLRKEFFKAEKHLKKILELYPDSEYYDEARIWLTYTYLKMDNIDFAKIGINEFSRLTSPKLQYLINNILAEIAIKDTLPLKAYEYYNKCISLSSDKSQKTSIYLNLLNIAKNEQHLDSVVVYLEKLSEFSPDQSKKDIKLEWIEYSRKARKFDDVLVEIDIMLGQPEYSSIYIKLELERAKIYLDQKDFESAKIFLAELSEKYSRKNESAEALFHLGHIALMESFDLELSLEYFEKSKKDRKTSQYGKRSRDMINRINDYKNLVEELDFLLTEKNDKNESDKNNKNSMSKQFMPKPKQKTVFPDSILFVLSEKLLFDFDRLNDAKNSYHRLIKEYPDSKFRPQALYVLDYYFPSEEWGEMLLEYSDSELDFENENLETKDSNSIEYKRDKIWEVCESSYNICAEEFLKLYNNEKDTTSLYLHAFINDVYLNDLEKSVNAYKNYVALNFDSKYAEEINERLDEIENSVHSEIELTNQKISYYYALESLRSGDNLDSVLFKFDQLIKGGFSNYKSSGQLIKTRINNLITLDKQVNNVLSLSNNDSIIVDNQAETLDSLYFTIAKIYQLDFMINGMAEVYFKKIINDFSNSKFRYESIVSLNNIDNNNQSWKSLLNLEYPDSSYISDSSYKQVNIIKDVEQKYFIRDEIDRLEKLEGFKNLFINEKDSISFVDTINIDVNSDSLNTILKNNEE